MPQLKDGEHVIVYELPLCDMHKLKGEPVLARYDAQLKDSRSWAYLCYPCWTEHSVGRLGVGLGQRLYLPEEV